MILNVRALVASLSLCFILLASRSSLSLAQGNKLPLVSDVAAQPISVHAKQMIEALDFTGAPLQPAERLALEEALKLDDGAKLVAGVQAVLDKFCLLSVNINPESRVKVAPGPAKPTLVEQGWSQFLVKVHNEAGVTAELKVSSPQAGDVYRNQYPEPKNKISQAEIRDRWCEVKMFNGRPLRESLSGLELEYRIIQIYSRDNGKRAANISFDVGQGTQDVGFRSETSIVFNAAASVEVAFDIRDEDGQPATAGLTIRDKLSNVYPSQSKRLAPDFFFHPQVYRQSGETVLLPAGEYTLEYSRGPEYLIGRSTFQVGDKPSTVRIDLKRWVDPAKLSWWSGDHHIHAAGCAHYTNPSEGVHASDMLRQILGEDLKVGCNLTWGPCFDYQKQFFSGKDDAVSTYPYLLRYDIEVSGFGSHQSGHLCLLRLKDQMYPGGESKHHWPTLGLNTLRWAKKQGAVCGPAHSGNGLDVRNQELPNYVIPPYNGIGANEFIVDITHAVEGPDGKLTPAVDFISTVDTNYFSELNMWYHSLNVGYRVRASGETDFPCITGERVGLGRSYVKLVGKLDYDAWCEGIRQGRNYVSDGRSHIMEFQVNELGVGENGSELRLTDSNAVKATAKVSAFLPETPGSTADRRGLGSWNLERSRIPNTRNVKVELIVNAKPVASKEITADGTSQDLVFDDVKIDRSSWVALRIAFSSHTNPVFVLVKDQPIRASRRSAQWCLDGVEQCWKSKERTYKADEMEDARSAYDHARTAYRQLLTESDVD
ncbi:MAG: CehA/McbA family metallohydrolase [Pirellula sp.]